MLTRRGKGRKKTVRKIGFVAHAEYVISFADDYSRQFSDYVVSMCIW